MLHSDPAQVGYSHLYQSKLTRNLWQYAKLARYMIDPCSKSAWDCQVDCCTGSDSFLGSGLGLEFDLLGQEGTDGTGTRRDRWHSDRRCVHALKMSDEVCCTYTIR